jgi:hypothetical protein
LRILDQRTRRRWRKRCGGFSKVTLGDRTQGRLCRVAGVEIGVVQHKSDGCNHQQATNGGDNGWTPAWPGACRGLRRVLRG